MTSPKIISSRQTYLLLALLVVGSVLSLISLYHHVGYTGGYLQGSSFCTISDKFNCEAVNASVWSSFFGIPVASYGLFFYLILVGIITSNQRSDLFNPIQLRGILLLWTFLGVLFSIILFAVSKFLIGVLCPLCLATYVVNVALFAAALMSRGEQGLLTSLRNGSNTAISLFGRCQRADRAALRAGGYVVSAALFAVLSQFIMASLVSLSSAGSGGSQTEVKKSERWEDMPAYAFQLDTSGGMFADFSKGHSDAPIQIVEFADIECPGCRKLYSDLKVLLERYDGLYFLTFKNYPLDNSCNPSITKPFHQNACVAAMFTRCAGEQGRYWEALDSVFTDPIIEGPQSPDVVLQTLINSNGTALGLDVLALESCMKDRRYQSRIVADIREGKRVGLYVTPSVWVNGKRVSPLSIQELDRVFSKILTERGIAVPTQ
jgi:protein-disulfide isomerase/uncharacterized membrane protein